MPSISPFRTDHRLRAVSGRAVQSEPRADRTAVADAPPGFGQCARSHRMFSRRAMPRSTATSRRSIAAHDPDIILMFGLAARTRAYPHRDTGAQPDVVLSRCRRICPDDADDRARGGSSRGCRRRSASRLLARRRARTACRPNFRAMPGVMSAIMRSGARSRCNAGNKARTRGLHPYSEPAPASAGQTRPPAAADPARLDADRKRYSSQPVGGA